MLKSFPTRVEYEVLWLLSGHKCKFNLELLYNGKKKSSIKVALDRLIKRKCIAWTQVEEEEGFDNKSYFIIPKGIKLLELLKQVEESL